ncbi:hypothetical protein GN277_03220 [Lachnospiraceae bacterium WCA-9-b2]|uniref:Uncharacterized protein n=1 Tax=Sporofaciens musculi TaxID=2681861 RepID=A0A7X3MDS6_9FIRM|nr:hypothetical protein [Sporofaciens musculi]MXP74465.1 hypothetical protein [Sporofaciens musculi]
MKKTGLLILLSCGMICGCSKEYIEMDILSSNNTTSGNWYELDIDVIADKDDVSDKEACSREIIQHILDNDFHSTRFSFDINGYPNNVSVDVFTSEKMHKKVRKLILLNTLQNLIQKTLMYKIISKTIQENLKYNTNKIYLMAGLRFATRCRKVENHVLSEISPLNSLIFHFPA